MILGCLCGALWFAIFLISKIAIFHSRSVKNKSALIMNLFGITLAGCLISALILEQSLLGAFYGLVLMFSLFILYMPFYYTVSSSVSVQTMIFIHENGKGRSSKQELQRTFTSDNIIRHKLDSMASSRMIDHRGGSYVLTKKGGVVAWFFQFMKKIWNIGPGG